MTSSSSFTVKPGRMAKRLILAKARRAVEGEHHESRLMIFMSRKCRGADTMALRVSSPGICR